jgi:hypothetical protein
MTRVSYIIQVFSVLQFDSAENVKTEYSFLKEDSQAGSVLGTIRKSRFSTELEVVLIYCNPTRKRKTAFSCCKQELQSESRFPNDAIYGPHH